MDTTGACGRAEGEPLAGGVDGLPVPWVAGLPGVPEVRGVADVPGEADGSGVADGSAVGDPDGPGPAEGAESVGFGALSTGGMSGRTAACTVFGGEVGSASKLAQTAVATSGCCAGIAEGRSSWSSGPCPWLSK